jgi:hypothetical protein
VQEWATLALGGRMPYSKLPSLSAAWYPRIALFDLRSSPRTLVCSGPDCYSGSAWAARYCLPDRAGLGLCKQH